MVYLALCVLVPSMLSKTEVVLLGTGTPRQDPERWGSASAVVVNGTAYIVDCGPGVVRRAAAAFEKGVEALKPSRLRYVFITHLHSDHTIGYPDLILSPWVVGRSERLQAFGPTGLGAMTQHLLEAYKEDIEVRSKGLEHGNPTGYQVDAHEIKPGVIFKDANVTVKAFAVHHGSWKEAYGYRFETPDRTVVFSGDTSPCESVMEAAQGVDLLVHEAYEAGEATPEKRAGGEEWPTYMHQFHTSAEELGRLADKCKPKLLVLYHVLRPTGTTDEQLIAEVRRGGFTGQTVVGKDLDAF